MKKISATVLRGNAKGTPLRPHRFSDGFFQVSLNSNKLVDAIRVRDEHEIESWLMKGYGVRMSGHEVAPSIYTIKSVKIGDEA